MSKLELDIQQIFTYPYDYNLLVRKQKALRRILLSRLREGVIEKRIAILGGSTTEPVKNSLELFLLNAGIKVDFYESEYNKYYEDAVFGNSDLDAFKPDIVIIFTSAVNIIHKPELGDDSKVIQKKLEAEYKHYVEIWESLSQKFNAVIIQNNMELSWENSLGSLEATYPYGINRFIMGLNEKIASYATTHDSFYLHDINGLSARIGLRKWHNRLQYHAYKMAMDYDVIPEVALGFAKIIRGVLGKNKKCLVLDLDNTLWGGVIGDDGMEGIQIGHETPMAEAYMEFQEYVLKLKNRGIILAVCSKNEEDVAKTGFDHPDSVLHVSDFVSFHANWEPKSINIKAIADEINISTDSLVFIDDNPAERQIVRDTLPEVSVPEIDPSDVSSYIRAIEDAGYFESVAISEDDRRRSDTYRENMERRELEFSTGSYEEFLKSLQMKAEIDSFKPVYYDRIAQLTNKTNQFNLTTRRYTRADIEKFAQDEMYITLYGKLSDRFGDNGLVSVIVGEKREDELHINLWLMSCRVLKRGMELAMLDALTSSAYKAGLKKLVGYYYKTNKNHMVENMYEEMGFYNLSKCDSDTVWGLELDEYKEMNHYIALGKS